MLLLKSPSDDPAFNCALEKYLLTEKKENYLLFYINSPSVIVGRNQQIEAEVNVAYCKENNISIIRRLSGGGTVFHDHGNVNYSFITNTKGSFLLDSDPTAPVVDALTSFGIRAETGKRNEITVSGLKVSGTASYSSGGRQIFHGTLLHSTDLETLEKTLRGDETKRGRKIASVRSSVVNLNNIPRLDISTEEFLNQIIDFFSKYYRDSLFTKLNKEELDIVAKEALIITNH